MFKYNSNTKIITTDDIVIGSDNNTLGNSLTDAIAQNTAAIEELKANVKWLSMHGGSGSGGSGGNSTDPANLPSTFILTASYTNLSGESITDLEVTDGGYILVSKGTKISFTVTKTTISVTNINYIVTVLDVSGKSWASGKLNTDTNTYRFSITPTDNIANITVTVPGYKSKYARSQTFNVYVKIVDVNLGIYDILDPEKVIVVTDILDTTKLKNNEYELRNSVKSCHPSFEVISVETYIQDTKINMPTTSAISGDDLQKFFKEYGIYTVKYTYKLKNLEDGSSTLVPTSENYIYKDANKIFILCTGTLSNSVYTSSLLNLAPITYSASTIIFTYKIYGKSKDSLKKYYNVDIYEDDTLKIKDQSAAVETNMGYSITNTNTSNNTLEKTLTFKANGETFTYYVYLGTAVTSYFILRTNLNGNEKYCYNAVHSDTELNNDPDLTMEFPSKDARTLILVDGKQLSVWVFSKELLLSIRRITSLSTKGTKETTSLWDFIAGKETTSVPANTDGLLCIGWKNKVSASTLVLFTITSKDRKYFIKVYNTKIVTDTNTIGYTKTYMPKDDEFHLISFYFKGDYKGVSTDTGTSSFVIYIDGVQETTPLNTKISMEEGVTLTIPAGASYYNFFGFTSFNRGLGTSGIQAWPTDIQPTILRYLDDYDPIIPANYYAQYTQTFPSVVKYKYATLSTAMYTLFSNNNGWINFLRGGDAPDLKKFIDVADAKSLFQLAGSMPMYKIVPTSEQGTDPYLPNLNKFIYDTMTSYGQDAKLSTVPCKLYIYTDSGWELLISDTDPTRFNGFLVKYQGSSTLLYSVKNFEISTIPYEDTQTNVNTTYYFSPNEEHFPLLELSYNLKADLVDSSSSTNNVIGNVVNDYLTSPFNLDNVEYKCCLSGIPILLFMGNEIGNMQKNEFFLGIYNWNLNRDSWQHLGYLKIKDSVEKYSDNNTKATYCAITDPANQLITRDFRAAEIQDNSAMFDFSQYDDGLLLDIMLGDFKVGDSSNNTISESYTTNFSTFISDFSRYVRDNIASTAFNLSDYSDVSPTEYTVPAGTYYIMDKGEYKEIILSDSTDIYEFSALSNALPYHLCKDSEGRNVAVVGNSKYQFKELFIKNGTTYSPYTTASNTSVRFMIKLEDNTPYSEETNRNVMQIESAVKYYMLCMAFAMVDSVQKNLNIKTANWSDGGKVIWVPAFYDMDTALGLTNSGGEVDFKAFSNYIKGTTIIGDYAPKSKSDSDSDSVSGWFDTPSSYLFLFAKYDELLKDKTTIEGGESFSYNIPYVQWKILRGVEGNGLRGYGLLQSADYFCDKYLDVHLSSVHPLLMNLNYLYKYFSLTKNNGGSTKDTEEKRFHGTMRAFRREWLNRRLHFLDAMFGFNNSLLIGSTSTAIVTSIETSFNSNDIYIQQSMYPLFVKGFIGDVSVTVKGPAFTPLIFRKDANQYLLYILNEYGEGTIKEGVPSNTDIGFYGSKVLTYVSDHGQFLMCDTSGGASNTIVNDQIEEVSIITTGKKDVSLDLKDIPNCKRILLTSSDNTFKNFIITDTGKNLVLEELDIQGIKAENVTFQNCCINRITLQGTFEVTGTYLFYGATIGSYTEASTMKVNNLEIINSIFTENDTLTFTSETVGSSYTISTIKFKDNLTVNYKAKSISISNLTSEAYQNTAIEAIHNAKNLHAIFKNIYLHYYAPSDGTLTINDSIKVNAFYMNSIAHNDIYSLYDGVCRNTDITKIHIEGEDTWAFYSFPACMALTSCTHSQGTVNLWDYGVAWSKISCESFNFKLGSGAYAFYNCISAFPDNTIIKLNDNVYWDAYTLDSSKYLLDFSYIHALPAHSNSSESGHACDTASNYYTLIENLYSHGIDNIKLIGAFIRNHFSDSGIECSSSGIWGKGTSVWGTGKLGTRDLYIQMLKLIFKHGEYTDGIFLSTAFNVLPKDLKDTLTRYHSHLGSARSDLYVESGALKSCTHFYSLHDDEGLGLGTYYYNWSGLRVYFIDTDWKQTSIIFKDEMPKVEYINANIESPKDYPVSFENGNSACLKTLVSIFGWQSSVPYMKDGEKYLDNIPAGLKSAGGAYEFTGEGWTGLLEDYNVNIYEMLFTETTENEVEIKLKDNAAAILPNAIQWDHDGFGFAKKCTWDLFKKILLWLLTREAKEVFKGTIGKMFHDCYVSNVPNDRSKIKNAFKGALYGYTVTYRTFQSLHLMSDNGTRLPADFTDIFKDKNSDKTTAVTGLAATFYSNYLYQWDDYTRDTNPLGITPKSTSYMPWAFRLGTYSTTKPLGQSIWASDDDATWCTYKADTAYSQDTILPPNFFDFVAPSQTYTGNVMNGDFVNQSNAKYMFYACTNLRGTLPDTDTLKVSNLKNISDSTGIFDSLIIDPVLVEDIENTYRIFPNWYCDLSLRDRFNVYIPVPPKLTDSTFKLCLFVDATGAFPVWNSLPKIVASRLDISIGTALSKYCLYLDTKKTTKINTTGEAVKGCIRDDIGYTLNLKYPYVQNLGDKSPIINAVYDTGIYRSRNMRNLMFQRNYTCDRENDAKYYSDGILSEYN